MSEILDLSGNPIQTEPGLVDRLGRKISVCDGQPQPMEVRPANKQVEIAGILVAAACADGSFRQVVLKDKEAKKITKLLQKMHGGRIELQMEPVFLVVRRPSKK